MALTKVSGGVIQPDNFSVGVITATSLNAAGVVTASTVQVGSATTIHTTGIDLGSGSITSHNINSTGIVTSTGLDINGDGDISGDLSVSGNVSIGGTLTYEDVTNIDSVGLITARDGIIVTGGLVGIGTTNPETELHVQGGNGFAELRLSGQSGSGGSVEYYETTTKLADIYADEFSNLIFRNTSSNLERIRITSDGNIGIGTTNPEAKLEVKDGGAQGIIVSAASTQQTDTNKALRVRNNNDTNTFSVSHRGQGYFEGSVGIGTDNTSNKLIILNDHQGFVDDSAQPQATLLIKHGTTGSDRRWIGIGASTTGAWIQSSSPGGSGLAAPLSINPGGGYVGIETTVPSALLQIKDGTNSGFSDAQLKIGDNTDTGIQINQASNNVGGPRLVFGKARGTLDTPTTILADDQIVTTRGYGYVGSTGGWVHGGYYGLHADGTVSNTSTGLDARFTVHTRYNGGEIKERLRIYPSGTVGINTTTSPTIGGFARPELYIKSTESGWTGGFHLEESENDGVGCINHTVDGLEFSQSYRSAGAYKPIIFRTSGQRRVEISTDGNVGIGTTIPASLLTLNADSGNTDLELRRNNEAANGNRYGRIKFSSLVSTEVASISAQRWSNSDHTSYLTFATARDEGELTDKFQINSFGTLSGNHELADHSGTYRSTVFYLPTNHYEIYSAPSGGNKWMRFGWFGSRGRYRICFNTTGNYYAPGSVIFDVQLEWSSPYIYIGNVSKLGSQYVTQIRSTSNLNGSSLYLEAYVSINANQTGSHIHCTAQVLGTGDRQFNLFNYGYDLSNLTYTSSAITL